MTSEAISSGLHPGAPIALPHHCDIGLPGRESNGLSEFAVGMTPLASPSARSFQIFID